MAKWFGKIGYNIDTEVEPGVWLPVTEEHEYYGDIMSDRRIRQSSDGVNDNINISHRISIVADPFAIQNCSYVTYAEIMGTKWKVNDVEVQYPRLVLSVGGMYNNGK